MIPLVWSERPEPNAASLKDCAYSAMLMALVFGGFTKYPFGIYSVAEREELERSDDQPDETGASLGDLVVAVRRRYGLTVKINAGGLAGLLATPGIALVVAGSLGTLPVGSKLRRWQPGYVGGHAITAITRGDGTVLWLDPLATNKYPGDSALTSDVLAFARGWGGSITVRRDQFAPTGGDMPALTSYTPGHLATVKATSNIRSAPAITGNTPLRSVPAGQTETWAITGTVKGEVDDESGSDSWYVRWNARWEYTAKVNVTAVVAPVTDCTPAVTAALAPVQADLEYARAALTQAPELERERIAQAEAARIRSI